jgi:hypothetical protein
VEGRRDGLVVVKTIAAFEQEGTRRMTSIFFFFLLLILKGF